VHQPAIGRWHGDARHKHVYKLFAVAAEAAASITPDHSHTQELSTAGGSSLF
jgi:hypothetical protein